MDSQLEPPSPPTSQEENFSWYSSPSFFYPSSSSLDSDEVLVRRPICKSTEFLPNTMKSFAFEHLHVRLLIVHQGGRFHAVGAQCRYCGDALVDGALGRGRVRCADCGSCYSLRTGDIEVYPAMNPLSHYLADVEDDTVYVSIEQRYLNSQPVLEPLTLFNKHYSRETFVIIGGGPSAAVCIESLRQLGFSGRVLAFMQEKYLPYDRTTLAKGLRVDMDNILLRSAKYYEDLKVDIILSTRVESVDVEHKTLMRQDGVETAFDKLFIATGCKPKRLSPEIPGISDASSNIFHLRTIADLEEIREALTKQTDLVVVGSSYLGAEIAATCSQQVKTVTIVSDTAYPFQNVFGMVVGRRMAKLCTDMGINMRMSTEIVKMEIHPDTWSLAGVVLKDGALVPAQMLIVCIGVTYATEFLVDSGVALTEGGAVKVDEFLCTNIPFIYAGGDVASAPLHPFFNTSTSTGHYPIAQNQGKIAAGNMLGSLTPSLPIPMVSVSLSSMRLQYAGWIKHTDPMVMMGSPDDTDFVAYYLDGSMVTAIVTHGFKGLAAKFAETIYMEKYVTRDYLHDHAWSHRMFTCHVHDRDEDYKLDLDQLRKLGLVF